MKFLNIALVIMMGALALKIGFVVYNNLPKFSLNFIHYILTEAKD